MKGALLGAITAQTFLRADAWGTAGFESPGTPQAPSDSTDTVPAEGPVPKT